MRILVSGGVCRSLINFRGRMLEAMVQQGHEVYAAAGESQPDVADELGQMGVTYCAVEVHRRGMNVFQDWQTYRSFRKVIAAVQPDVFLGYTIKPVVYGSLAAANCQVPHIAAMITGAGTAQPGSSLRENVVRMVSHQLYRSAFRHATTVFFQNSDDEALFRQYRLLGSSRVVRIAGSGVDSAHYVPTPPVLEPVTFLMIARLLVNKGVREFAGAAARLREEHGQRVRFLLVGGADPGGGGVGERELNQWQEAGTLEYLGQLGDVRPSIAHSSVYVLPSYREGTPRTVLEAMAMGRPIITTDVPGCRETVLHEWNGLLVPPRNVEELAKAMNRFVENRHFIESMGARSVQRANDVFDVHKVNDVILDALGLRVTDRSSLTYG